MLALLYRRSYLIERHAGDTVIEPLIEGVTLTAVQRGEYQRLRGAPLLLVLHAEVVL